MRDFRILYHRKLYQFCDTIMHNTKKQRTMEHFTVELHTLYFLFKALETCRINLFSHCAHFLLQAKTAISRFISAGGRFFLYLYFRPIFEDYCYVILCSNYDLLYQNAPQIFIEFR